ncbi:hypothetical protein PproGo58_22650 [Pseudomonas protegens]|nr:hypothetical protein PproGo58_22650 [Pseudomonas protegens]
MSHVNRQGAEGHQVTAHAHGQRAIVPRPQASAVQRPAIAHAPGKFAAGEFRTIGLVLPVRRPPGGHFVAHRAGAAEVGNARRVQLEFLNAAVLLLNAHIQLAAHRIAQVLDAKGPRWHLGVIQNAPLLRDQHPRIGPRHATDFRRIAAQVGGQHVVTGGQTGTGVAHAAEQVGVQVVFSQAEVGAQLGNRP